MVRQKTERRTSLRILHHLDFLGPGNPLDIFQDVFYVRKVRNRAAVQAGPMQSDYLGLAINN